eukprot:scaffold4127_cov83-Alexandrium_tamarense.AAC.1
MHGWNVAIAIDRAGSVDDENCWKLMGVFITVVNDDVAMRSGRVRLPYSRRGLVVGWVVG